MNKRFILLLFLLFELVSFGYSTELNACQAINSSGYYHLNTSIIDYSGSLECFPISVGNVEFDLGGNLVDMSLLSDRDAIKFKADNLNNITIENGAIQDSWYGIRNYDGGPYRTGLNITVQNIILNGSYPVLDFNSATSSNLIVRNCSFGGTTLFNGLNSLSIDSNSKITSGSITLTSINNNNAYLKLGNNINNYAGTFFNIGVSNVTIDLNGYNLDIAVASDRNAVKFKANNLNNITVKNGSIQDSWVGIRNYDGVYRTGLNVTFQDLIINGSYYSFDFNTATSSNLVIRNCSFGGTTTFNTLDSLYIDQNSKITSGSITLNNINNNSAYLKLVNNITNFGSSFFSVGTNNIIIDLNGFTIDGVSSADTYGVRFLNSNLKNITVKNGVLKEFWDGIKNYDGVGWKTNISLFVDNLSSSGNVFNAITFSSATNSNLNISNSNLSSLQVDTITNLIIDRTAFSSATTITHSGNTLENYSKNLSTNYVGNIWGDFTCNTPSINYSVFYDKKEYVICKSNNYSVNSVLDTAPIYKILDIYLTVNYSNYQNGTIYTNSTLINVSASSSISTCDLNWNGTIIPMSVSGNYCYLNQSGTYENTYQYFVNVTGINTVTNTTSIQNLTMMTPPINSCTNISLSGSYYMNASITNSTVSNCINISVNNVTFDCKGYSIDGNDVATNGIYLYRSSANTTNVTIKNCIISDWATSGIYIYQSNGNNITNVSSSSSTYGIYLYSSANNSLSNFTTNNNNRGIGLVGATTTTFSNFISNGNSGFAIYGSTYNTVFSNFTIYNNYWGIYITQGSINTNLSNFTVNTNTYGLWFENNINTSIFNSTIYGNANYDIYLSNLLNPYCNYLFSNVTDSYGKYHFFSNQSVNIDGWTNISSITLCNADNSLIKNLNYINNYNTKGQFISLYSTDNSILSNLTINNYSTGIYSSYSLNNNLSDFTTNSNSQYGLFITTSNNTRINNFTCNYNAKGLYLDSTTNNNILSNFSCNSNTQRGIELWGKNNNLSNFATNSNSQYGIFLASNLYNFLTNFTANNNVYGIYLGTNGNLTNFTTNSNSQYGIYSWGSSNNSLSNFTSYNNSRGIYLYQNSVNNTIFNSNIMNNTYNLYFDEVGTSKPENNTFYNNYLENQSKIYSDNWSNINYFNSSLSGYNIGNRWNNFISCSSSEIRGVYKVCTNPANYTINSTNNIYDFAPLIVIPEYISPTIANNSNYGGTNFTIRIRDTQGISTWFNVTINGVSYAMTSISGTDYEYISNIGFNTITNVTYNVSYSGNGIMETRTFTYYPDYTNAVLSSYGFVSFLISIGSVIFLFFNLNFQKRSGSKKGMIEVIAGVTLLLVVVTAGIFVNSWYQDFSDSYNTKKLGSQATANSFEIVAIKNESSVISVYIRSKAQGYSIVNSIKVNDGSCILSNSNVILGNSITKIGVECTILSSSNNYIVAYTKNAVFSANKPLIS